MTDWYTFRGRFIGGGEWCYGSLVHFAGKMHIVREDGRELPVDPDTVGQCTGLLDKNGTAIFVGDIVKHRAPHINCPYVIGFGWYDGEYEDSIPFYGFYIREIATGCECNPFEIDEYIKIGNRWDNPELMEVQS